MKVFDKKIWNDCIGYNSENWLFIAKDENTLSLTVVGAKGTVYSSGQLLPEEEVLTITAVPKDNYTLKSLKVNGNSFENGGTITVYTAISIEVETTNKYTLTLSPDINSTITVLKDGSPLSNQDEVTYGDVLTISAAGNTGYVLDTLTVNGTAFTSGNTYTVTGAVTVVATSTRDTYTLTISSDANTTMSVIRNGTPLQNGAEITYEDELTITAVSQEGYTLSTLTVNGSYFTNGNTYTVTGDVTVVATSTYLPLTQIMPGDRLSGLQFNTSLLDAQVIGILENFTYDSTYNVSNMIQARGTYIDSMMLRAYHDPNDSESYALFTSDGSGDPTKYVFVWSSKVDVSKGILTTGWQNLNESDAISVNYQVETTIDYGSPVTGWNGLLCGAVISAPVSSFTPFTANGVSTGIDFGNATNGDTDNAMDSFLAGLTYDDGQYLLVVGEGANSEDVFVAAIAGDGVHALGIAIGENMSVLYSDVDDGDFGVKGWKNLTDGKFAFGVNVTTTTVNDNAQNPVWNGVLFGAVTNS